MFHAYIKTKGILPESIMGNKVLFLSDYFGGLIGGLRP